MTTASTGGLQRNVADRDESSPPRLPGLIDARFRRMEVMGYLGAGIITIAGLLILMDENVGLGTRLLVGVLVMIAMRHTMRPATSLRRSSPATPARHRRARRSTRRAGS